MKSLQIKTKLLHPNLKLAEFSRDELNEELLIRRANDANELDIESAQAEYDEKITFLKSDIIQW